MFFRKKNKKTMDPFFGRQGGKSRLAKTIYEHAPPPTTYQIYCEPFVGAGSVFFQFKTHYPDKHYIINDANRDIYDIWNDLKHLTPNEMEQLKEQNFEPQKDIFNNLRDQPRPSDIVSRLHRNLYLSHNSFNTQRCYFANRPTTHSTIKRFQNNMEAYHDILQPVVIKNKDYTEILKQYDHPTTLFYIDPPYHKKGHYYEGQDVNTDTLLNNLQTLTAQWMLSYNEDPTLEAWAREHNFTIHHLQVAYTSHYNKNQTTKTKKTELVIKNF